MTALAEASLALDTPQLAETYDVVGERQFEHGKVLIRDLGISRGQQVLDIGAGTGRLAEYVADIVGPPGRVVAIDPLPLRIDIARRRLAGKGTALVGSAEDLSDFPGGSFHAVYYNSVFHWLKDKLLPLQEAARVLRARGRLGITTASREHPHQFQQVQDKVLASGRFADVPRGSLSQTRKVSAEELRSLFLKAGLLPVSIEVRTLVDFSPSVEDVFAFSAASSFGNFLAHVPQARREALRAALAEELETLRTPRGIRLERHLIFAIAEKP